MKFKLFDSGQAHAKVKAGKAEWTSTFKPESDTHCANHTTACDYEYQVEIYVNDVFAERVAQTTEVCQRKCLVHAGKSPRARGRRQQTRSFVIVIVI